MRSPSGARSCGGRNPRTAAPPGGRLRLRDPGLRAAGTFPSGRVRGALHPRPCGRQTRSDDARSFPSGPLRFFKTRD